MHVRFSFLFALFASSMFAVGCSSADTNVPIGPADTGSDATIDTGKADTSGADTGKADTKASDTAMPMEDAAGIKCGDKVCGMGQVCCASGDPDSGFMLTCATSCPDGGAELKCDGPEDCPTGAKICCAEVKVEGTFPGCTFKTGVAECRGTCASSIPTTCPSTATVRRCHSNADCTEGEYNKCCLFESGGTSAEFCANSVASLIATSCK
jgi:hypothetical protein